MLVLKFVCLLPLLAYKVDSLSKLKEVFSWKGLTFAWPSKEAEHIAIKTGDYVPENNLPLGMEIWRDKLFVTIPRWKNGIATSLGYISLSNSNNKSPAIIPYPNWEVNTVSKGEVNPEKDNHIISTFRVAVDACDRLWVMDSGFVDIFGDLKVFTPPAVLIYDLNTDKLIKKYVLGPKVLKEGFLFDGSFFPNIIVDSSKRRCDDAFAYLPDVSRNGIVVYSLREDKAWRFEHHFFHFDPLQGNFNSGGVNFQWNDGVFGLALGPENTYGFRTIYFHPTASLYEFSVESLVLRKERFVDTPQLYYKFKLEGYKGENTQTTVSVFDEKSNTILLTQLNRNGVACWNPRSPLKPENVVMIAQDPEKLSFTNEIRVDGDRNLWILSNKIPNFLYGHLNNSEINYRIFKVKVDDAIAGTCCQNFK